MSSQSQRQCLFCPNTDLSKTHIWPSWLNKLLNKRYNYTMDITTERSFHFGYGAPVPQTRVEKVRQGTIFTQKPRLVCETCNTGWMKKFEDEMLKFSLPIFTGEKSITLNQDQIGIMNGWLSLITILAAHLSLDRIWSIVVTEEERQYVKDNLRPPDNWTICYATLHEAKKWDKYYRANSRQLFDIREGGFQEGDLPDNDLPNTQISSWGMGEIFIQVFISPSVHAVADYRGFVGSSGLPILFPPPRGVWPFTKGKAHFPANTIFDDEGADEFATAFEVRMDARYGGRIPSVTQPQRSP